MSRTAMASGRPAARGLEPATPRATEAERILVALARDGALGRLKAARGGAGGAVRLWLDLGTLRGAAWRRCRAVLFASGLDIDPAGGALDPPAGPAPPLRLLRFHGWTVDPLGRGVRAPGGAPVRLTAGEFILLATLAESPGAAVSRDALAAALYGRVPDTTRSVDIQICRLRRRLRAADPAAQFILTVRHRGYMIAAEDAGAGAGH
ncbi:MAG TPA: winged helix-turn-helix domain-containing protein [Alphaproteobacteria bacterium]|nr:winged helix-turn-helix domain-containing protein [Alphaproteobacteria bacterium]